MPHNIITTAAALDKFIPSAAEWVGVDTEFLRERTYSPQLCLIQISNARGQACVDPLAIDDLSALQKLFSDDRVLKIFHSCRQDLETLDTRLDLGAINLYDTQLAAAFCGHGEQVSYATLVESLCGVKLAKTHTRTDWSARPLSPEQLQYALDDVAYLQTIREKLDDELERRGRLKWHRAECVAAAQPTSYRINPQNSWWRLKGVERLNAQQQSLAKKLYAWRERTARKRNLPRNWVLSNSALLKICYQTPQNTGQLRKIDGVGAATLKKSGDKILNLIGEPNEAIATSAPLRLTPEQHNRVKRIMQIVAECAEQYQIGRGLLTNRSEIENFIRGETDLKLFKGWRREIIGAEILNTL